MQKKFLIGIFLSSILASCGQTNLNTQISTEITPNLENKGQEISNKINSLSDSQIQALINESEDWQRTHPDQDINTHAISKLSELKGTISAQWSIGEWTGLGPAQGALCNANLVACYKTKIYKDQAQRVSRLKYGNGEQNGKINAYRHTYWNALMTRGNGVQWATNFANAHEQDNPPSNTKGFTSRDMDFYNNTQGRTIGTTYPANLNSDTVVESKIVDYMTYGKLKVFNKAGNALVWSNSPDACMAYNC